MDETYSWHSFHYIARFKITYSVRWQPQCLHFFLQVAPSPLAGPCCVHIHVLLVIRICLVLTQLVWLVLLMFVMEMVVLLLGLPPFTQWTLLLLFK